MFHVQQILSMARQNNGVVTTAMAAKEGIPRGSLKYLADRGSLARTGRGVYLLPEAWEDEYVSLQGRFKRGIYSLETALFLWALSDSTPARFHMTFPGSYNLSQPKKAGLLCTSCKEPLYSLGLAAALTPGGNRVAVYNRERTLCDVLRKRNEVDIGLVAEAFKNYALSRDRNIPLLSAYAKTFKVEEKLRSYLEVLL